MSYLHQILIFAMVFGAVAPHEDPDNFNVKKMNSSIVFEHIGKLSVGISYGHLAYDINFESLLDVGENMSSLLKNVSHKLYFKIKNPEVQNAVLNRASRSNQVLDRAMNRVRKASSLFLTPEKIGRYVRNPFAIGLGIFTSVFSIFEEVQIQKINARIDNLSANQKIIVSKVLLLDKAVATNSKNIDVLEMATRHIIQVESEIQLEMKWTEVMTSLEFAINEFSLSSEIMETAALSIFHGQLHPDIFKMDLVDQGLANLTSVLHSRGFRPVNLNRDSFLRSKISWLSNGRVLRIVVHIPVTPQKDYDLYKLIPSPQITSNNTIVHFEDPTGNILAVNPENNLNIVMTDAELQKCMRIKQHYACDNRRVVKTTMDSCLGLAHQGKISGVLRKCSSIVSFAADIHLIEYADAKQVIVAMKPTVIKFACFGKKPVIIVLERGTWVVVSTCSFTIANYAFSPVTDFSVAAPDFFEVPAAMNISSLILDAHDLSQSEMDDFAKKLDDIKGPPPRNMNDLRDMTWVGGDSHLIAVFVAIAVTCLLLGGIGILCCFEKCACCRRFAMSRPWYRIDRSAPIPLSTMNQTAYRLPSFPPTRMAPPPPSFPPAVAPPNSLAHSSAFAASPSLSASRHSLTSAAGSRPNSRPTSAQSTILSDFSGVAFRPARTPLSDFDIHRQRPVDPIAF